MKARTAIQGSPLHRLSVTLRGGRPSLGWGIVSGALLLLLSAAAMAQTAFIPIEYGGSYTPTQLNNQLISTAAARPGTDLLSKSDRDVLLNEGFPEITLPDVSEIQADLDAGNTAYFEEGDYVTADEKIGGAVERASERLLALSLRPGFAEAVFNAGLTLVQARFYALEDKPGAEQLARDLIQLFPTGTPSEGQYPPDIIELFKSLRPSPDQGVTVAVGVADGCNARVNGQDVEVPGGRISLVLPPGKYGFTEVCSDQTTRAFIVDVTEDMAVDFHDTFAEKFTWPASTTVDGADLDEPKTAAVLTTLGRRLGVKEMLAAGLVGQDKYRMTLVDVGSGTVVRSLEVGASSVASPEKMQEAVEALYTGSEFVEDLPPTAGGSGISLTAAGAITAGAGGLVLAIGGVMGGLAYVANEDFLTCNQDLNCRQDSKGANLLADRRTFSIAADALYGVGSAVTVAGLVMIIVDQASGGGEESADAFDLQVAPTPGGAQVGLGWTF